MTEKLRNLFYIFIGGGLGSVLRFLISHHTQKLWSINLFPIGTFIVNLIGCFLIGILTSSLFKFDQNSKLLLITGFCGGFTTFSTFSAENISLWQNGSYFILVLYVFLSVFAGLGAVYFGLNISRE